jgi:predicted deacylase
MASRPSLVTTTVDFNHEGVQRGHIQVPYSHDRSAYGRILIPLVVARRGEGPTILLTGGVHGDEHEGPIALMRLIRELSLADLNGCLIIVPAINLPAYLSGTRTSPIDRLNLNRRFPGDRNGMPTDMIAHYIETALMPNVDYCFDFHAGGASLNYLPSLVLDRSRTDKQQSKLDGVVAAFRAPLVLYMDMLGEDRLIAAAAERHDVCFFTGEFGGADTLNIMGLQTLYRGLRRVLDALGVVPVADRQDDHESHATTRTLTVKGAEHHIFATRPGVFEPRFRLGEEVAEGALAGLIHDPLAPWAEPEKVHFSGRGLAVCIRTRSLVVPGDCLGHIASDG